MIDETVKWSIIVTNDRPWTGDSQLEQGFRCLDIDYSRRQWSRAQPIAPIVVPVRRSDRVIPDEMDTISVWAIHSRCLSVVPYFRLKEVNHQCSA